jgi:hypothetical protein
MAAGDKIEKANVIPLRGFGGLGDPHGAAARADAALQHRQPSHVVSGAHGTPVTRSQNAYHAHQELRARTGGGGRLSGTYTPKTPSFGLTTVATFNAKHQQAVGAAAKDLQYAPGSNIYTTSRAKIVVSTQTKTGGTADKPTFDTKTQSIDAYTMKSDYFKHPVNLPNQPGKTYYLSDEGLKKYNAIPQDSGDTHSVYTPVTGHQAPRSPSPTHTPSRQQQHPTPRVPQDIA